MSERREGRVCCCMTSQQQIAELQLRAFAERLFGARADDPTVVWYVSPSYSDTVELVSLMGQTCSVELCCTKIPASLDNWAKHLSRRHLERMLHENTLAVSFASVWSTYIAERAEHVVLGVSLLCTERGPSWDPEFDFRNYDRLTEALDAFYRAEREYRKRCET